MDRQCDWNRTIDIGRIRRIRIRFIEGGDHEHRSANRIGRRSELQQTGWTDRGRSGEQARRITTSGNDFELQRLGRRFIGRRGRSRLDVISPLDLHDLRFVILFEDFDRRLDVATAIDRRRDGGELRRVVDRVQHEEDGVGGHQDVVFQAGAERPRFAIVDHRVGERVGQRIDHAVHVGRWRVQQADQVATAVKLLGDRTAQRGRTVKSIQANRLTAAQRAVFFVIGAGVENVQQTDTAKLTRQAAIDQRNHELLRTTRRVGHVVFSQRVGDFAIGGDRIRIVRVQAIRLVDFSRVEPWRVVDRTNMDRQCDWNRTIDIAWSGRIGWDCGIGIRFVESSDHKHRRADRVNRRRELQHTGRGNSHAADKQVGGNR